MDVALSQIQGAQIQALQRQVKLSGTPPRGGLKLSFSV
jgi:hypothetical protein